MSEIKLTPARIELLRAVGDGRVVHYPHWGHSPSKSVNRATNKRVTGAMSRLRDAGLVRLPRPSIGDYSMQTWRLTPAGETAVTP